VIFAAFKTFCSVIFIIKLEPAPFAQHTMNFKFLLAILFSPCNDFIFICNGPPG